MEETKETNSQEPSKELSQEEKRAKFEAGERKMKENEYGVAIRAFFKERGLTLLGQGEDFLLASSCGWSKKSKWNAERLQAIADSMRLAQAAVAAQLHSPGKLVGLDADDFLAAPIALTEDDLKELEESGAWEEAVKKAAPPGERERLMWAVKERKSSGLSREEARSPSLKSAWGEVIEAWGWRWLFERLELSIKAFEELSRSELAEREEWSCRQNTRWIGARLGRPQKEADLVARLARVLETQLSEKDCAHWFFKAHMDNESSFALMMEEAAESLGYEGSESACELWSSDGAWVRAGILSPMNSQSELVFYRKDRPLQGACKQLFDIFVPLTKDWKSESELMEMFYQPFEAGDGLSPSDWEHLGPELDDILAALSRENVKVLLWGEPGTGKSSLAGALSRAASLTAIKPAPVPQDENNGKTMDLSLSRLSMVLSAEKLARAVGRPAIVVDECEPMLTDDSHKIEITQALEGRESSQIWIANSLHKAHEAFLRRFDFILKVSPMPLSARERLAKQLFGEGPLAGRMAQSMRNPAEIVSAKRWCEAAGESSWAVVSRKMAGHQRAVSASGGERNAHFEVIPPGGSALRLEDFAGNEKMRREIQAIAGMFADPSRYAKLGAKIPKGYLLAGGPGSGKTWFARVLSSVAGVPMVVANGASLASHAGSFSELFAEVRKRAPCVAFIDEFDVVGTSARKADGSLDLERQKILNQFLVELDGFDPLEGVLFLAATHNASSVDKAVTRAGRLGRQLNFGNPGPHERPEVWKAHLKAHQAGADVNWGELGEASRGFSYAQIGEAAERAKMSEAANGADAVGMPALLSACDEVFWGDEAHLHMTEAERWRTAVHEAGHALAALREGLKAQRATIRPRSGFLGAVWVLGEEGAVSLSEAQIDADLRVSLAGYAAERAVFGAASNGASSDLAAARARATEALQDLALGRGVQAGQGSVREGLRLSERSLIELEDLGREKLEAAMRSADELCVRERSALEAIARELLAKRDLSGSEIEAAAGPAPKPGHVDAQRAALALAAREASDPEAG